MGFLSGLSIMASGSHLYLHQERLMSDLVQRLKDRGGMVLDAPESLGKSGHFVFPEPNGFNDEGLRRTWYPEEKGRIFIVRKNAYGFHRVYNIRTQSWEGNAFEDTGTARALANKLEARHG